MLYTKSYIQHSQNEHDEIAMHAFGFTYNNKETCRLNTVRHGYAMEDKI